MSKAPTPPDAEPAKTPKTKAKSAPASGREKIGPKDIQRIWKDAGRSS